ncbi:MAG: serine/threonine protein kinase [Planctomycetota bacterium]|jgi:serine/threonine protein kinase
MRKIGKFEITEELGRGGMGIVYRARDTERGRVCALKVLSSKVRDPEQVERFRSEGKITSALNHPSIVKVFETGTLPDSGREYLAMEFVDGVPLTKRIDDDDLSLEESAALISRVAMAVHAAHEAGVVHRDLKPANILIQRNGTPKVTDFGIAVEVGKKAALAGAGLALGTPAYLPPEQARGEFRKLDRRSDVYALGAILFELVTGFPPFQGESIFAVLANVAEQVPPLPTEHNPNLPRKLENVILKAMRKSRRGRYHTAKAMAEDLGRYLRGEELVAQDDERTIRSLYQLRKHGWFVGAALVLGFLLPFLSIFLFRFALPSFEATDEGKAQKGYFQAAEVLERAGMMRSAAWTYAHGLMVESPDGRTLPDRGLTEHQENMRRVLTGAGKSVKSVRGDPDGLAEMLRSGSGSKRPSGGIPSSGSPKRSCGPQAAGREGRRTTPWVSTRPSGKPSKGACFLIWALCPGNATPSSRAGFGNTAFSRFRGAARRPKAR